MKLFRKRYFPQEVVELNDDIVFWDENILVTKWRTIRPKPNLSHGISAFFIDKGIKVSKFYTFSDELLYWYCDIGDCVFDNSKNEFMFVDLMADVIIYPDGEMRVVDLAEAADVFANGSVESDKICKMLKSLDFLMEALHSGQFREMQNFLEKFEKQ